MSRTESQARTRALLIETAKRLFLHDGYQSTSLEKVADAAGFSKGAVYSNFRNKDELGMAVLDEIRTERAMEIVALIQSEGTVEDRLERFEKWAETVIGDRAWTSLELEFGIQTRGNAELTSALGSRFEFLAKLVESGLSAVVAEEGIHVAMPPREVAIALLCLGVGLGLFRAMDPSVPVSALTNTVRLMAGLPIAEDRAT